MYRNDYPSSMKAQCHLCQSLVNFIYLGLFLDLLFCSIGQLKTFVFQDDFQSLQQKLKQNFLDLL